MDWATKDLKRKIWKRFRIKKKRYEINIVIERKARNWKKKIRWINQKRTQKISKIKGSKTLSKDEKGNGIGNGMEIEMELEIGMGIGIGFGMEMELEIGMEIGIWMEMGMGE